MATPASSATSPSPPMAYLSHAPLTPQPTASTSSDTLERDQRQKAIQKFLARAEISMVTRALRARLSYASYKATHNIPHVPLRDLEAQTSQTQAASFSRTIAAKRKASGIPNYYNTPSTPGPSTASPGGSNLRRGGSGAMLPPSSVTSARSHYPSTTGQPTPASHGETPSSSKMIHSAPNLYTSILAPPPAKQARTIHNVQDPPVPAPMRPAPSPRLHTIHKSPRSEANRSHVKSRHSDKASKAATSPERRKAKRASADKGKRRQRAAGMEVDTDGDVDMKAAATLTSLLLHHRPSIGSASSPRSSIDGSETGSTFSHFAQSSARTTTGPVPPPAPPVPSTSANVESPLRHCTPPPPSAPIAQQTTPRTAPTDKDSEAADLMLFLATSPSPARPGKAKDHAAFQTLSGSTRPKGRVLFQSGSVSEQPPGEAPTGAGSLRAPTTLSRSGEGSFMSSISSIGSDLGHTRSTASPPTRPLSAPLLPPPSLPSLLPSAPTSPMMPKNASAATGQSPKPANNSYGQGPPMDFNIHEFINASPSPARGAVLQGHKSNHGLRADVGRKLFEEEQMRYTQAINIATVLGGGGPGGAPSQMQAPEQRGERQQAQHRPPLGSGIDIVQS